MKAVKIIFGVFAVLFSVAFLVVQWMLNSEQKEKFNKQTGAARSARWKKKEVNEEKNEEVQKVDSTGVSDSDAV